MIHQKTNTITKKIFCRDLKVYNSTQFPHVVQFPPCQQSYSELVFFKFSLQYTVLHFAIKHLNAVRMFKH